MFQRLINHCAMLLFIGFLFLPGASAASDDVGEIVAVKGTVVIKRTDPDKRIEEINARLHEKVMRDDLLETAQSSRAKILLQDESVVTIRSNSKLYIKEFLPGEKNQKGLSTFGLIDGFMKGLVGKNNFEVHTSTAVAAARGTYYAVWVENIGGAPTTVIAVLSGTVEVSNIKPEVIGKVLVEPGMITRVLENNPPTEPAPADENIIRDVVECMSGS